MPIITNLLRLFILPILLLETRTQQRNHSLISLLHQLDILNLMIELSISRSQFFYHVLEVQTLALECTYFIVLLADCLGEFLFVGGLSGCQLALELLGSCGVLFLEVLVLFCYFNQFVTGVDHLFLSIDLPFLQSVIIVIFLNGQFLKNSNLIIPILQIITTHLILTLQLIMTLVDLSVLALDLGYYVVGCHLLGLTVCEDLDAAARGKQLYFVEKGFVLGLEGLDVGYVL